MKLKLVFMYVFFLSGDYLVKTHELPDLIDTTPERFPFHAVIHGRMVCGGILIDKDYVITPAYCVYGASTVTVYLGFTGYPYFVDHHSEPNAQIHHSGAIFMHEDFAKIQDQHYLNNIALVKLSSPATISDKVHPGLLISREDSQLLEGRYANISGWLLSRDESIKYGTVQLRNQDTCSYLYEDQFLRHQAFCVKWFTNTRLNLLGNAATIDDQIIGFQTNTPHCVAATSSCTRNDMVLNIVPFLDWISHKTGIPIEHLTGKTRGSDNHDILIKLDHLTRVVDEILSREKTNTEKYDQYLATLNTKIENTIVELRQVKNEQVNFALALNEQIGAIKSEINNSRAREDQNRLKLQEEINGARTELTNGLTAQRSLADLEARFENLTNSVQVSVIGRIDKLEGQFNDLVNTTERNKIEADQRYSQQQQEIATLREDLNEIDVKGAKERRSINEQVVYINATVKEVWSAQKSLQQHVEEVLVEFKFHISEKQESLHAIEEQLTDVVNTAHKNALNTNLRLGEIERVVNDQRKDFDKHVSLEFAEDHLLWVEIKSLNATLREFKHLVFGEPSPN